MVRLPALLLAIDAANPASGAPGPDPARRVAAAADHVASAGETALTALDAAGLSDPALGRDVSGFVAAARAGHPADASAALADTDQAWRAADAGLDTLWRAKVSHACCVCSSRSPAPRCAGGGPLGGPAEIQPFPRPVHADRPRPRPSVVRRPCPQLLAQVQNPQVHWAFKETTMSSNDALSDRLKFMSSAQRPSRACGRSSRSSCVSCQERWTPSTTRSVVS